MSRKANVEDKRRKVERELDRQLEDTFPASDPLKITRRPPSISKREPNGSPEPDKRDKHAHTDCRV
jgi:hypothetical protein